VSGDDGVARLLAARALKGPQQDARVDRTAIVELAHRTHLPASNHKRVAAPECSLHSFDGGIELAVQIVHLLAAHRGVRDLFHWSGSFRTRMSGAMVRYTPSMPL